MWNAKCAYALIVLEFGLHSLHFALHQLGPEKLVLDTKRLYYSNELWLVHSSSPITGKELKQRTAQQSTRTNRGCTYLAGITSKGQRNC